MITLPSLCLVMFVASVGLKMTLLDPALSIDLQYLGVSLPIPLPGVVMEPLTQTTPSSQGRHPHRPGAFILKEFLCLEINRTSHKMFRNKS